MFGLLDSITDKISEEVDELIDNPLGYTVDSAMSPVHNTLDI